MTMICLLASPSKKSSKEIICNSTKQKTVKTKAIAGFNQLLKSANIKVRIKRQEAKISKFNFEVGIKFFELNLKLILISEKG